MPAYIDKSMLILEILNAERTEILITDPRRFGKSTNLSMIRNFFEKLPDAEAAEANRKLFIDLKINKFEDVVNDHLGKYSVIFLNFYATSIFSYDDALCFVKKVVHYAFIEHNYLINSNILNASQKKYVNKWCDEVLEDETVTSPNNLIKALNN